jgi:hypothetical protein
MGTDTAAAAAAADAIPFDLCGNLAKHSFLL